MSDAAAVHGNGPAGEVIKRDFLTLVTAAAGAVGAAAVDWPMIDSMNPAQDVLALSAVEVGLAPIGVGSGITVMWQGKPVFVRHRTGPEITRPQITGPEITRPQITGPEITRPQITGPEIKAPTGPEIKAPQDVPLARLIDPHAESARVKPNDAEWIVQTGICTRLGCVPLGDKATDPRGDRGGWFWPSHASQYDTSGRVRHGPAPANLAVPGYAFDTDSEIKIG